METCWLSFYFVYYAFHDGDVIKNVYTANVCKLVQQESKLLKWI